MMVAAATESEVGVENLWKRGPTGGRRDYPDFGQYLPRNWFVAFQSAAGYMWSPKKYWYQEKHNKPWDIFAPAMDSFNAKRKKLIKVICLMMETQDIQERWITKHNLRTSKASSSRYNAKELC
ncbi:hypothetical protein IV203_004475 [Nitzschia inconspicua]|uniref:Uncharacterized protein n=1 Tax=Nitzschia inconspicua TaxID=303405 RepID=A0A9K3L4G8_9STRA|nr:hypothetical protein IV203_004475 [Nitzschia inconspicua]